MPASLPRHDPFPSYNSPVQRLKAFLVTLVLVAIAPACTVESHPTGGVRADARGRAVILAPRCADERIEAVQVADASGTVRWRVEGGGNEHQSIFVVGREPTLMQETDPLDEPLDADQAYVATLEYAGSLPDVDVGFRVSSLSSDRVIDDDGDDRTVQEFYDEADLDCLGGWLWVFGAIGIGLLATFVAAIVVGFWVILRVLRKAKRQRQQEATPRRPDLSGR